MKKIIILFLVSLLLFTASLAYSIKIATKREKQAAGYISGETTHQTEQTDLLPITASINGYALTPEGDSVPVQLTISVENVLEGEEAYQQLLSQGAEIPPPEEGKEYIIISVTVTYEGGELETLDFYENYPASWAAARIHFHIPNEGYNTENMTSYLANPIWGHLLSKGESASGEIAFLQDIGNTQPLYFVGYNQVAQFKIQ